MHYIQPLLPLSNPSILGRNGQFDWVALAGHGLAESGTTHELHYCCERCLAQRPQIGLTMK